MVFSLGKSLPTVPLHLHLVVGDEFPGTLLVPIVRVGPDGRADELVASKEDVVALSVGVAGAPHADVLHQPEVADLGVGERRGGEGGEERGGEGRGGEGKKQGRWMRGN